MFDLYGILKLTVSSLADVFMEPIFLMVILVVYFQYRKLERIETSLYGKAVTPIKRKTAYSVVFGIAGGYLGTALMTVLGITISIGDFSYVLPLAIFLMMVRSRYICFSYAGGIISILSLLTGWPDINVSSMMAVVAVLHMIESILIYIDGHSFSTPIITRTESNDICGGFYLQKFWPIPMIVIVAVLGRDIPINTGSLPTWWPAFIPYGQSIQTVTLKLTGLVAILGYGDMTLSRMPREKTRIAAGRLALYSVALLVLSLISANLYAFKFVAAIFAPLAHEGLILYSQREEKARKCLFEAGHAGIMVLSVKKEGPGYKMGLKPGDRIIKINNIPLLEYEDLESVLNKRLSVLWIEVMHPGGSVDIKEYNNYERGIESLECIYVERHPRTVYRFNAKESSRFKRLFGYLKRH
ncbi:MAG TPA: PDZ domain-containing protein [Clostridia bacterium]|nr:PDZ domain-containing protein [Clostridia bacterium]